MEILDCPSSCHPSLVCCGADNWKSSDAPRHGVNLSLLAIHSLSFLALHPALSPFQSIVESVVFCNCPSCLPLCNIPSPLSIVLSYGGRVFSVTLARISGILMWKIHVLHRMFLHREVKWTPEISWRCKAAAAFAVQVANRHLYNRALCPTVWLWSTTLHNYEYQCRDSYYKNDDKNQNTKHPSKFP